MERMTRKEYIEKLEEYVREIYGIDDYSLAEFLTRADLSKKETKHSGVFLKGIEQGLELAIRTLEEF